MKRIHKTLLLLFVLSGAFTQAQDFRLGVKGGLNSSTLSVDPELDLVDPDSRFGLHLGIFGQMDLNDQWVLQPELFFHQEGAKYEDREEIQRAKLGYISLGAGIRYELPVGVHFMFMPQLDFLSGGEFAEEDKIERVTEVIAADRVVKGTLFSLGIGGGYAFDSGLEISARYNFGLTDLNDDPEEEGFFEPGQGVKTRSLMLSVGYLFDL